MESNKQQIFNQRYIPRKKKKKKNFSNSSQSDTSIRFFLIVTFGPRVNVVKNIVTGNRSGRRRELISRTGAQRVFLH